MDVENGHWLPFTEHRSPGAGPRPAEGQTYTQDDGKSGRRVCGRGQSVQSEFFGIPLWVGTAWPSP